MQRNTVLWALVLFFGTSLLFSSLRRLTEDSSTAVTVSAQFGALALVVLGLVLFMRRRGR